MDVKEFSQAIRAACYGCDDAFVGKAVAENWSIEQSAIEWQKQLVAERDQARDAADQPSPASRQRGAQPLTDDGTGGADTAADNHGFMQLVEECMKETGCTYRKACHAMAKKHPQLHGQFITWCSENVPLRDDAATEHRAKAGRA